MPTVDGAGPGLLSELLGVWESELRAVGFPIDVATNPGISADEVARVYGSADLEPPAEVVTWFAWRNGQPFGAPEIGGWFGATDAASSISLRAVGFELGHGIDYWEETWVRLGQADPAISLDTRGADPAPLVRVTAADVWTWGEDISDVRSLCTPVVWFIDSLRRGWRRWDGQRLVAYPPTVPVTPTRWCYL